VPIAGLVADANVLLSAVIGKVAFRVFRDFTIPVHTTRFNWSNDRDLQVPQVHCYTTAALLKALES
jgi:hypothetical protein